MDARQRTDVLPGLPDLDVDEVRFGRRNEQKTPSSLAVRRHLVTAARLFRAEITKIRDEYIASGYVSAPHSPRALENVHLEMLRQMRSAHRRFREGLIEFEALLPKIKKVDALGNPPAGKGRVQ